MSRINLDKSFRVALAKRGMQKQELAAKLGVSKERLSNITNGSSNISVQKLDEIAEALGYKLWRFIKFGND